ncbi:MAG: alpha/beta hydrolase [Bacteroidota bacterium]
MSELYKTKAAKEQIMALYDQKLASLNIEYTNLDISTSFGRTRVIRTGDPSSRPIVVFHGIHAGAPLTLEAIKELNDAFCLYVVDTIGQATKSDYAKLKINGPDFGVWANEVFEGLELDRTDVIGVSYGGFIVQKLITHHPERIDRCVLVVPAGLANGPFGESMKKLSWPLLRFMLTKKDAHLVQFLDAFSGADPYNFQFQKALLTGVKMDYRRPGILQAKDVAGFDRPVFMIVSDQDVFFPSDPSIRHAKKRFANLKDVHVLEGSKHMPGPEHFSVIQAKIRNWLESE